ncbi:integral membrane protein, YjbE family [Chromobacterium violaceum]|uniref:Integral membrane protein, YjbE family n=1 Tax=Chromobacterium violaceum TaxID=536 RepID=A0A3S4HTL1_CHRVL|nr:integral membrane protein, YjbE family [Chromobacterium violaceum]
MEPDSLARSLSLTFQVSFLDLILSGDNALVIALACRSLPEALRRRAVLWGTGFAIVLRLLLAAVIGVLLRVPMLKLIGAVILLAIAIQLLLGGDEDGGGEALAERAGHSQQLWNAVMLVVGADLALSLDNVVALAAAAQGSVLFLLLGLALSVPLLMYGSLLLSRLMDGYPLLIPAGAAVLGWLAGGLAAGDALWGTGWPARPRLCWWWRRFWARASCFCKAASSASSGPNCRSRRRYRCSAPWPAGWPAWAMPEPMPARPRPSRCRRPPKRRPPASLRRPSTPLPRPKSFRRR